MKAIDHVQPLPSVQGRIAMVVSDLLREARHAGGDHRPPDSSYNGRAAHAPDAFLLPEARPEPSASVPAPQMVRGGLVRWQIERVLRHIETGLDGPISLTQLAATVRLSTGYFSRAFKQSIGTPPHAYIMMCRIERAKTLLLTTEVPLCEVALECGLADQAHLSRLFRRLTGETPFAWRRRRKTEAQGARGGVPQAAHAHPFNATL